MEIARAGADLGVKAGYGFEVVVEHVRFRRDHGLDDRGDAFQEIGRQDLDRRTGRAFADRADRHGEMLRPAILEVVAVHGRDDDMVQAELLDRVCDAPRLEQVEILRPPRGHVAEGAAAGAYLAHDHHGGVALGPAFAGVGTARLLADRHQLVLSHDLVRLAITLANGGLYPDPAGLFRLGIVGAMRLFGVTFLGQFQIAHGRELPLGLDNG